MTNQKRIFLAVASVLIGMGLGLLLLLLNARGRKPVYNSPYTAGATPPPVPEASAPPVIVDSDPTPSPHPGEVKPPEFTYYQRVDTPEGPSLRAQTKPLAGTEDTDEARLRQAVQAMTEGEGAPLPKGTTLLRLKREANLVILDLSAELKANFSGGDRAETLLLNALTATVSQLAGAEKLQIFVAGEAIETLAGGQSLLEPLTIARK